jgi:hypothetical protein
MYDEVVARFSSCVFILRVISDLFLVDDLRHLSTVVHLPYFHSSVHTTSCHVHTSACKQ